MLAKGRQSARLPPRGPIEVLPNAATQLAELAVCQFDGVPPTSRSDRFLELLAPVIDAAVLEKWADAVDWGAVGAGRDAPVEAVERCLDGQARRQDGVYLTPTHIAEAMAALVEPGPGEAVLDLSAGAATLLCAAIRRHPQARAVAVEKNWLLAVAAAINLVATRRRLGQVDDLPDRVYVGDGLAADARWSDLEGRAAAVVGNPPYVREKGNRELFSRLQSEHPHLAEYFGPRMDLQYLFFHRSASFLRPGGRLVFLTSAYWLTATNADSLREDMSTRLTPELLIRVEQGGVFADAPGQHTLLSAFCRGGDGGVRAVSTQTEPDDWVGLVERAPAETLPAETFGAGIWTPFADAQTMRWKERLEQAGTALGELLDDRQGFVSGADRATARHIRYYPSPEDAPPKGQPIFVFDDGAVPDSLADLSPTVVRPLLRASALEPNEVIVEPCGDAVALYLDGELDPANEAIVEAHLGRFRPVLARRREVRQGSMPWHRLHWPRDRAEQTGPKLVVPRRAPMPCFALDLSASCVSSDCTYLVCPSQVDEPIRYLITLMVVLNSAPTQRYLRHFGKAKGRQLEFYSQPLRSLPVPLRREGGRLIWVDGVVDAPTQQRCRRQIDAHCERLGV